MGFECTLELFMNTCWHLVITNRYVMGTVPVSGGLSPAGAVPGDVLIDF